MSDHTTKANTSPLRTGPDYLIHKDDWPQAKERWLAFWNREVIDRAVIMVTAPKPGKEPLPEPSSWEEKYTNVEYVLKRANAEAENTYYGGEAFPQVLNILGYVGYGGEPVFDENTIWIEPILEDWDIAYRFDYDNPWLKRFLEIFGALAADGHGNNKYLVNQTGMHPPMDGLMKIRGSERLCFDLVENPEAIHRTLPELMRGFRWAQEIKFASIPADHGMTCLGFWAPGTYTLSCCDFGALFGPKHFEEFVVPEVVEMSRWLDYCIFHLDGPTMIPHLPLLLDIEELDGIQWVQGAGGGGALDWIPLYREILAAGKVVLAFAGYHEVEELLSKLDPRGLLISTSAPSVEAAEALLKNAERWSCRGVHPVP